MQGSRQDVNYYRATTVDKQGRMLTGRIVQHMAKCVRNAENIITSLWYADQVNLDTSEGGRSIKRDT